jgi:hypothetical protein
MCIATLLADDISGCRDGIYFDKILVSEYKLFKRSNKANSTFEISRDIFRILGVMKAGGLAL